MSFAPLQVVMDLVRVPYASGRQLPLVPACCTGISALLLVFHFVLSRVRNRSTHSSPGIGASAILRYRVSRLLGSLCLLAVSVTQWNEDKDTRLVWEILMSTPYLHVNFVLFVTFCVYMYRDVLPLATFSGVPQDLVEGPRLWVKIALLFMTAVVVPLFTPRQYIPVDPLNPMAVINPEQTASIISFALYFFLDRIVFQAYRQSQLQEDELYPLCDTDSSTHLMARSFQARNEPNDPDRPYIETLDESAGMRPWVWIAVIFFGPLFASVAMQWYIFLNVRRFFWTRCLVRNRQLVFTHSLRIRMKAETTESKETEAASPAGETSSPSSSASDPDGTEDTATLENSENSPRSDEDSVTVGASASSNKSASKQPVEPVKEEAKKNEASLVGRINNLVTTDLGGPPLDSRDFLVLFIYTPLQIAFGIWFLYGLLDWAVWVGVASIILLAPIPGYMAKFVQSVQKERLKRTDDRVQSVSEAVNVLRMIKLFGWEGKMNDRIAEKRDAELVWIRKRRILDLFSNLIKYVCWFIFLRHFLWGSFVAKTLIMGQPLNASKVFSSMTVFDILRYAILGWLNQMVTGKVSLDRVNAFLKKTELLDSFDEKETPDLFPADQSADERIGFRNATFSWSKDTDGTLSRQRQFMLKIDEEVIFQRGRINLVVGPTGSGFVVFYCEMHWIPSSPESWYNLPRDLGVAYAAQESWVLNQTIRDNIIFDTPFEEARYKKVVYQCALEPDLALFQAGDQTEVGEKGLTLSGGQKARLTLARAIYSNASILLLDDVLAALDVHTSQWIVDKCFGEQTHNVALVRPIAHFVVTFGSDGQVNSQVSMSEIVKRGTLAAQIKEDQKILDKTDQEIDTTDPVATATDGKLIMAEEIQEGHVSASALKMYLLSMAGRFPIFFFTFFFGGLFFQQIFVVLRTWMLGYWAIIVEKNMITYASISVALTVVFISLVFGQLRASRVIHKTLVDSVLTAPLRWLDVTPASRIIARVTNDVRAVDESLPNQFWPLAAMIVSMLVKFAAVILYTPIFFVPGMAVGAMGAWIGQIYIAGQLPVKRLMSNTRAPVLAHFGAAIAGLVSLRAYGAEAKFSTESLTRIDRYTRAARNYYNLNRWVSVRIDILGSMFSAGLATYLVYIKHTSAGDSGFLINQAITFTAMLLWAVRVLNEFEVQASLTLLSLERIQAYINIEHESPATESGKPPAYWPASGDLRVDGLSAKYSEDSPNVLHNVSFHIKSGDRVGIVGRTGSGKSSLTLALLRCIPTEGSVTYDGVETSKLNLDALRSSITIIPQVPELLSGSLRANLDPFGQYDDLELNYALRAAGLFALQSEMDEGRITLDSTISTGGSNLSVGQRQIFALARAIVRKSKILILDEDFKTDSIIQNSLRQELQGDVSLITVAHRLQTIMDFDKIMVLDAGHIVEFDSPKQLLTKKDGKLRGLVEESGDRDALFAMAGAN
ncbi:hypothetical protein C8R43DRAFT_1088261 [Mycena crocata]|nr:hypothetical protein C8R43DRAFT_1088261 [Mycena crocata]